MKKSFAAAVAALILAPVSAHAASAQTSALKDGKATCSVTTSYNKTTKKTAVALTCKVDDLKNDRYGTNVDWRISGYTRDYVGVISKSADADYSTTVKVTVTGTVDRVSFNVRTHSGSGPTKSWSL